MRTPSRRQACPGPRPAWPGRRSRCRRARAGRRDTSANPPAPAPASASRSSGLPPCRRASSGISARSSKLPGRGRDGELAVALPVAVDAVPARWSPRWRRGSPRPAGSASASRRESARDRCAARGSGWRAQKPPLRPVAAQPSRAALEHDDVEGGVAPPWPAAPSTTRRTHRRRRQVGGGGRRRAAGTGSGRRRSSGQNGAAPRRPALRPRPESAASCAVSARRRRLTNWPSSTAIRAMKNIADADHVRLGRDAAQRRPRQTSGR